jgi:hypothetical protein
MIAKTVTGSDFTGALAYGAGIRADRTNQQAELLSVANVGSLDPAGIAAEMRDVAAMSSRIQQPVWHTILSWSPEEQVSRQQKLQAAALYCELMGAGLDRHQVAVYEHRDKNHPHVHIYINRVPIDGGAALDTSQNYARNVKATQQIREQLGLAELPQRAHTTRALDPDQEPARGHVRQVLTAALQDGRIRSLDQLVAHLRQEEIEAVLKRDAKGVLVGTSFHYQQLSVKGTDVGVKAKQLRDHFGAFGRAAVRSAGPGARPGSAGLAAAPGGAGLVRAPAGALLSFEDEGGQPGPGTDDAQQNENELRRKKRRQRHH